MALIARKEMVTGYQMICQSAGLKLGGGDAAAVRHRRGSAGHERRRRPDAAARAGRGHSHRHARRQMGRILRPPRRGPAGGPYPRRGLMLAGEIRRNVTVYNGQNPQRPCSPSTCRPAPMSNSASGSASCWRWQSTHTTRWPSPRPKCRATRAVSSVRPGCSSPRRHGRLSVNFLDPHKPEVPPNPIPAKVLVGCRRGLMSSSPCSSPAAVIAD